jgi:lauroyl/myristoyl acyltransferase
LDVAAGVQPEQREPLRAPTRERLRERLAFRAYRAGEAALGALPRRLALAGAAAVGNVAFDIAGHKRDLIRANVARPLGLAPDDKHVATTARRAFRNYARYLVDMMRLGGLTEPQVARLVRVENIEILREARAAGRGVILCTVHVGGMDLIGAALKLHGELLNVVADDTTYPRLYEHLAAQRRRHGIELIGWRNLRGLFRALRSGENLVLFCDGGYRPGDVPVELCGEPTTFPPGPATLSARTGAPMLPVACSRQSDESFVARGLPVVTCGSEEPAEIFRATQELADALGGVIADDPGQWYMFRPVWPLGEADRARATGALHAARRGEDWRRWS